MSLKIADFRPANNTASFDENIPFVETANLIDKPITILKVVPFTSTKGNGDGVHILIQDGEEQVRTCTYATVIVKVLSNPDLIALLEDGETIETRIIERISSTSGRKMLDLED